MFILSTSWNASRHDNGSGIVNEIREAGFDTIELGFTLTEKIVKEILSLKDRGAIRVSSLHNICPLPPEITPKDASPDFYSIASTDEAQRRLAIEAAKKTIDYTAAFGARVMVLHAGRVQIKDRTRDLAQLVGKDPDLALFRDEMIKERSEKSPEFLKNSIRSLKELAEYSKTKNVALAVENRYYYREIPTFEEMKTVFGHFREGEIFYWHDVGHAEVFDRLGMARHKEILDNFANRLIGVHLHDIIGVMNDHKAPGTGTFDFKLIRPYIGGDTLKVIEAHGPATAADLRRGVEYLGRILGR